MSNTIKPNGQPASTPKITNPSTTTMMDFPIAIHTPNDQTAIADALYRCVIGFDTNNKALFDSSWAINEHPIFDLNGTIYKGFDDITQNVFDKVGPMDTTHTLSNIRVNKAGGAYKAKVTAYALANHFKAGTGMKGDSPHLLTSSIYDVEVVMDRKDHLWKIKTCNMKIIWAQGDWSVMG